MRPWQLQQPLIDEGSFFLLACVVVAVLALAVLAARWRYCDGLGSCETPPCLENPRVSGGPADTMLLGGAAASIGLICFLAYRGVSAKNQHEAHTMLVGTPDCRRDCGALLNTSLLESHGQVCCGHLMLRMLTDVGNWLDKNDIEWYVTYGTLLGAFRHRDIIPWTDDVDIVIPSPAGQAALREQTEIPYRFGYYGNILRGGADYTNVSKKLPHHPSGNGAHMWVNDFLPLLPSISCEGELCKGRKDPNGNPIPARSTSVPDWIFSGRTSYYFMDVYTNDQSDNTEFFAACGALKADGTMPRSQARMHIGDRSFPVHHNAERCVELWYGSDWRTPTKEHVSDYVLMEAEGRNPDRGNAAGGGQEFLATDRADRLFQVLAARVNGGE